MAGLVAKNLVKTYISGDNEIHALAGINIEIQPGELVAITGTSGSGKSTLMHMLGCLDTPTSGEYFIDEQNTSTLNRDELAEIRNKKIGFVFQKFNLLQDLTATGNVALPYLYSGNEEKEAYEKAKELLAMVELTGRENHYPYQLSGGQQQRVAIARSLINKPSFILADEPTGNLDTKTGDSIMAILDKLNTEHNTTIVLVTHEQEVAKHAKRIITLIDGKITSDTKS